MPKEIAVDKLKPHPRNKLIYGQEDVADLVAQIEERGRIVVPLIVNSDYVILSGHRRWGAAKIIGIEMVPCEIRTFDTPEDELEFLLHSNITRKKSGEQLAREGIALEEVISVQSAERRNRRLKQFQSVRDDSSLTVDADDSSDSMQEDNNDEVTVGRTRDEVAKVLKIRSGKQFDRMKAVIKKADELREQEKIEDAELLLAVLNRSPLAAHNLMSVSLESLTDEDREDIKTGKKAPRQFLPEKAKDKPKKESLHKQVMGEINAVNKSARAIEKAIYRIDSKSEKRKIYAALQKTIGNLQALLPAVEVGTENEDEA